MSNNRQNVTWVEVCSFVCYVDILADHRRVFEESPRFLLSSHISAALGSTACGHRETARMPHPKFFNYPSYGYHGRDVLELPCLLF
jgi:hypothetical protein